MAFPSPSVVPPTFTQWPSAQYQGPTTSVTFGPAPFFLRSDGNFEGIFMPNVRNGDVAAPRVPGSWVVLDLLDVREISVNIDIAPPFGSYQTLAEAQSVLTQALTPTYSTEYPFFLQLEQSGTMFVSMVRPRKRDGQVDLAYVLGQQAFKVPLSFHASDPTWYAAGTLDPSVGVPAPLGGFAFPLSFPLSFGGGSEVGVISAVNDGDLPVFPIITFTGPCTYPTLTNASLPNNPFLQFAVTMAAGDQLVINTDPKYPSASYYTAGSDLPAPTLYALSQGSSWWGIAPGTNTLQFTTLDVTSVAGYVTVAYSSAYSSAS